uniref:Uncharacterized protein n=1 Tax=Arundo donax TaxID=35708 RepID=A0A0A9CF07_ARUDO
MLSSLKMAEKKIQRHHGGAKYTFSKWRWLLMLLIGVLTTQGESSKVQFLIMI